MQQQGTTMGSEAWLWMDPWSSPPNGNLAAVTIGCAPATTTRSELSRRRSRGQGQTTSRGKATPCTISATVVTNTNHTNPMKPTRAPSSSRGVQQGLNEMPGVATEAHRGPRSQGSDHGVQSQRASTEKRARERYLPSRSDSTTKGTHHIVKHPDQAGIRVPARGPSHLHPCVRCVAKGTQYAQQWRKGEGRGFVLRSPKEGLSAGIWRRKVVMCPSRGNDPSSGHPRAHQPPLGRGTSPPAWDGRLDAPGQRRRQLPSSIPLCGLDAEN